MRGCAPRRRSHGPGLRCSRPRHRLVAGSFGPRKNRELGARTQQGPVRSRGAGPLPSCYALGGLGERIGLGHQVSWVLPATGGYPAGPAKRRFITPSILPALFLKSNGPTQAADFQCQGGRNAHHDVNRQQLDQDGPRAGFSNQSRTPHGSGAMTAFVNRARSRHGTNYLTRHCWIQPSSRPPMTPEGSGMALYLEHAISHPAAIARYLPSRPRCTLLVTSLAVGPLSRPGNYAESVRFCCAAGGTWERHQRSICRNLPGSCWSM
jgi:hypothetical protein